MGGPRGGVLRGGTHDEQDIEPPRAVRAGPPGEAEGPADIGAGQTFERIGHGSAAPAAGDDAAASDGHQRPDLPGHVRGSVGEADERRPAVPARGCGQERRVE